MVFRFVFWVLFGVVIIFVWLVMVFFMYFFGVIERIFLI